MEPAEGRPRWRASWGEIVGAWLGIWTPPRDSYIPPVPVFRIALGAAVVVAATLTAVHFMREESRRDAARVRRETAATIARLRARIAKEQLPRHARFPGTAIARAERTQLAIRRRRIVHALEGAITTDALRRYRRGVFEARVIHTTCIPFVRPTRAHPPDPPLRASTGKYECLAATGVIPPGSRTIGGETGYPVWARVDFRRGRATWCKINPRPGERGIGEDLFVPLVRACDLFR